MKLNVFTGFRLIPKGLYKFMLVMKIAFFILLMSFLSVSASVYSQKVSLNVNNAKVKDVLNSLKQQTGYRFLYSTEIIEKSSLVSLEVNNIELLEALDKCFKGQAVDFIVKDKTVVIKEKPLLVITPVLAPPIKGKVVDVQGTPLAGVFVKTKNGKKTAVTSASGNFSIVSDGDNILMFSFVGFESQEVDINGKTSLNIILKEASQALNQVVVVGYGTVDKKDLTGAVATVDVKEMAKAPVVNFDQALAGRVSGVSVANNDGQPGQNASIVIRGGNSLTQSNEPLYVIDGFPMEDFSSSALSPNDIASISVLKDASATAIYGSRGANGVIVIETKRGVVGKPVIEYNVSVGIQKAINKMELMGAYDFVKYQDEIYPALAKKYYLEDKGKKLEDYIGAPTLDLQNSLFRTAPLQIHNLSLRGGNVNTKYSISSTLYNQEGIVINSGNKRYQGRASLDQTINKKLKTGISIGLANSNATGTPLNTGPTSSATSYTLYRAWGYRPVTASNIDLEDLLVDPETEGLNLMINPVISLKNEIYGNKYTDINLNAYVNYEIINGLNLKITGGTNSRNNQYKYFYNSQTYRATPKNSSNIRGTYGGVINRNYSGWLNENTLNYKKRINKVHIIDVLAGFTMQERSSESFGFEADHIPVEELEFSSLTSGDPYRNSSSESYNRLASFLSRINYSYKGKYLFTASFRADGSSKFLGKNRWGYFPSTSFAWKVKEESFLKNVSSVSEAKLRVGYGVTGNNRVGDFDKFPGLIYSEYDGGYSFNDADPSKAVVVTNIGNSSLKWESTEQTNLGLDVGFLKNKINVTVDLYRKVTKDLLLLANLPRSTGFINAYRNIGSVENKGLEISLNTVNINTGKFQWESNFNISFNKNKILSLVEGEDNLQTKISWETNYSGSPYIAKVGYPAALYYGYIWDGNYQYTDFNEIYPGVYKLKPTVTTNGNNADAIQPGDVKYRDINGDLVVNSNDLTIIGNPSPKHIGGFNNTFSYGSFSVSALLQWSYGNDILNANRLVMEGNGLFRPLLNQFATYANRWTPENQNNTLYRSGGHGPIGAYSSRVIEDGSFLRLKTVSFFYKLPEKIVKKASLSDLRINVTAQNLLTWTNYSGMDPEVSTRNSALTPGFDYSAYPMAKSIVFGLNAKF
ncbi:TonB-dependent receptor [Pseudopedobacter beijingensis]|uniref:TonB-dependent receptor n=1 Tax=Pseudopedobacter beijingensis TaxID=1207056 RepID=A0ABW4I8V6_9SPHI